MLVVKNDLHREHFPRGELHGGKLVRPFECPERWDHIAAALDEAGMSDSIDANPVPDRLLNQIHDEGYLRFLGTAWERWLAAGAEGEMIPTCFPVRRLSDSIPVDIDGQLGYYAFAAETSITSGTYGAAFAAASIAHTAQQRVSAGAAAAFALCRPPGHHASRDYFGGYCFLNNAAVAAQGFLNDGAERVAVLDVDFHHGNGTQDIFYDRGDVFFASLHGDPLHEFPYFSGYAIERGQAAGEGANANYPLAPGTNAATWFGALDQALSEIDRYGIDALVVSLGVDTFRGDPISSFTLESDDYFTAGAKIAALQKPTVYCMEGGYAVAEIGTNTANVLVGHSEAAV